MNQHPILVSPAWTAAGWTMLHLVWIGAVGGLGVAILRRLMRPARPETRHAVAVACLLTLMSAPVLLFAWIYQPGPITRLDSSQASSIKAPGRANLDIAGLPAR
jgi:hypothetical protein